MAELVDAQVSGICGRKAVEVQVLLSAPFNNKTPLLTEGFFIAPKMQ